MAFKYAYKYDNGIYKAPAQEVGEMMEELEKSEAGLSPETLVDANRAEGTLLHNYFEWRDDVAAERYRETQAQLIIRSIVIVEKTTDEDDREKIPVRGFVNIVDGNSRYITLENALSNDEHKARLIEDAKRDAKAFLGKYRKLEELASVNNAMEQFLRM